MRLLKRRSFVVLCVVGFILLSAGAWFVKFVCCRSAFSPRGVSICFENRGGIVNPEIQESEIIQPLFLTSSDMSRV
ncbi:hypothetical protein [Chlamydiifrater volucris]|uniref:hypothetical protein n=1 Tax=Chlamydiifrater volucris TaxID=2681470 RepID=UPI001BCB319C|nr:hypothetical protein [Chlamydiifrater volucris]